VGTSRRQWLPESPSPLGHISPWKAAQKSAHIGICPLSILWPSRLPSKALSAGLFIGFSGGRDAPASVVFRLCTTSKSRPLGVQTALRTFLLARDLARWFVWLLAKGFGHEAGGLLPT